MVVLARRLVPVVRQRFRIPADNFPNELARVCDSVEKSPAWRGLDAAHFVMPGRGSVLLPGPIRDRMSRRGAQQKPSTFSIQVENVKLRVRSNEGPLRFQFLGTSHSPGSLSSDSLPGRQCIHRNADWE